MGIFTKEDFDKLSKSAIRGYLRRARMSDCNPWLPLEKDNQNEIWCNFLDLKNKYSKYM